MFCHSCGGELPKTAKFCPKCGTAVVKKQELEQKQTVTTYSLIKKEKANSFKKDYTGIGQVPLFKQISDIKQNGKKILIVASIAIVVVIAIFSDGSGNGSGSSGSSSSGLFSNSREPLKVLDCLTCDGDGDCPTCNGYGRENFYAGAGDYVDAVCSDCHGSRNCRTCDGSGKR